ncbi:hypothetical protein [Massilia endophytica]|uniref:hypothetical protein n=1 Tax=Massilia endophytica TaxID=2899220 RepID=UPI001E55BFE8|nr:hypothetical protein [Massilia endophytica]UGQ47926.1 hypothetical protein LSQ66_05530 [Massilia endophytica]
MKALALTCALILSACGGSDTGGTAASPPTMSATTMADSFFSAVLSASASESDDTEPTSVDAMAATSPEDTEPAALN